MIIAETTKLLLSHTRHLSFSRSYLRPILAFRTTFPFFVRRGGDLPLFAFRKWIMPVMGDLRTPHERRSDQLSVLMRRAPPTALPARFFKTVDEHASSPSGFRFDEFDSDAETDGPPSETIRSYDVALAAHRRRSSASVEGDRAVRRFPSREMNSAVRSSNMSVPQLLRAKAVAALKPPPHSRGAAALEDVTNEIGTINFERDRANSFYGAVADDDDNGVDDDDDDDPAGGFFGPISNEQLKKHLQDDFEIFVKTAESPSTNPLAANGNKPSGFKRRLRAYSNNNKSPASTSRKLVDGESNSSPELRVRRDIVRRIRGQRHHSANPLRPAKATSAEYRARSYSYESDQTKRVDLESSDLKSVLPDERYRSRLNTGSCRIPLFVEEAGRDPRVAIINGDVQRVRMKRDSNESKKARRQNSLCADGHINLCVSRRLYDDRHASAERRRRRRRRRARRAKEAKLQARQERRQSKRLFASQGRSMWGRRTVNRHR